MSDTKYCGKCGRYVTDPLDEYRHVGLAPARIRVVHEWYGCDTGCCGHSILVEDANGVTIARSFEFDHPYDAKTDEEVRQWVRDFAREHPRHWNVPLDIDASETSTSC